MGEPIRVQLDVSGHGHGELRLSVSGLGSVDPCEYGTLIGALGAHLGLDAQALRKAAVPPSGEPPDPRFPGLIKLVRLAQGDWSAWGRQLVDVVVERIRSGDLLPLTETGEAQLRELFRAHEVSIVGRFSGRGLDKEARRLLAAQGLVPSEGASLIELAWRLGRQVSSLQGPPGLPTEGAERESIEAIVKALTVRPLSAPEREAVGYIERRGAVYMRRPVTLTTQGLQRVLSDTELGLVRGVIKRSAETKAGWRETAAKLRATPQSPSLQNDFDRVARTELHFAHAEGALHTLKEEASLVGDADPLVYKIVGGDSCRDCRRIWGPMAAPRTYRLSEVEARNDGRGNFGLPRASWGPCVGPIHPNCTEGPLHLWVPAVHDKVTELAALLRNRFGSR